MATKRGMASARPVDDEQARFTDSPVSKDPVEDVSPTEEPMSGTTELHGPDLEQGVPSADVADGGMLLGHAGGEPVLVVRRGLALYGISATCSHYGGALAEGILVGDTVRCPLHHACFDLRTGRASAPAFRSLTCWKVEERGARVSVTGKVEPVALGAAAGTLPKHVVVVGGGAAGFAAVDTLRRERYEGSVTLVTADSAAPYDRPNVSKDFLAGTALAEWMPMRPLEEYSSDHIDLRLAKKVGSIDARARKVILDTGESIPFDALLLATGADPIRLSVPGGDLPHVAHVRTLADGEAIIARCATARRAVVIGASFIGLEVAAALRTRGIDVHVIAPDPPLSRVLGPELSAFVRQVHEEHGVEFSIGVTATEITEREVRLSDGRSLAADLVVVGIGVRPALSLAQSAGLAVDRGVVVNEHMETSVPGIYAAGDIARWPDARTKRSLRVEHWVVAQRQGQVAARNILNQRVSYEDVPFFWSQHYDVTINYVGHVEKLEGVQVVGSVSDRDCLVAYREGDRIAAVATIGRNRASLAAEVLFRRDDQAGLEALLRA